MNEFFLYKQLCELESIAAQYSQGREFSNIIRDTAGQISSKKYRVAVIGEFKRGKSSLINTIIGADILPTDVLPMTAAITRLVYDTERKISINYKDGRIESRTIRELFDYATKYDSDKEKTALSVRDIEVRYPSAFCKNHIEIIDTPGLNENESMSAVTLGVMGEVDAAIMVISAKEPLSMTEQDLIVDLINQPGIRHIIFVVTFIDAMNSEEDKDTIIDFICERISETVFNRIINEYPENAVKAEKILKSPNIFGVSSRQASEAFKTGDENLLNESRFPKFKEELLALLTAAQTADMLPKTMRIINAIKTDITNWQKHDADALQYERLKLYDYVVGLKDYCENGRKSLVRFLEDMDLQLAKNGVTEDGINTSELEHRGQKIFIKHLTSLNSEIYTNENIRAALEKAAEEVAELISEAGVSIENDIRQNMESVEKHFEEIRERAGLPNDELYNAIDEAITEFPRFEWRDGSAIDTDDLRDFDIMPFVMKAFKDSLDAYGTGINQFICNWRAVLLSFSKPNSSFSDEMEICKTKIKDIDLNYNALMFNYRGHVEQIERICEFIKREEKIDNADR